MKKSNLPSKTYTTKETNKINRLATKNMLKLIPFIKQAIRILETSALTLVKFENYYSIFYMMYLFTF